MNSRPCHTVIMSRTLKASNATHIICSDIAGRVEKKKKSHMFGYILKGNGHAYDSKTTTTVKQNAAKIIGSFLLSCSRSHAEFLIHAVYIIIITGSVVPFRRTTRRQHFNLAEAYNRNGFLILNFR